MIDREYLNQPYIRKIASAHAAGLIPDTPGAVIIDVRHEAACPLLAGQGRCACNPDVIIPNRQQRRAQRRKGRR